jgi:hypothetical protein
MNSNRTMNSRTARVMTPTANDPANAPANIEKKWQSQSKISVERDMGLLLVSAS